MKGYLILDLSVRDMDGFMTYIRRIPELIEKHGGRYLVRGVEPEPVEGDWCPERVVVLEFPSMEDARAFLADPDAQSLFAIRHQTTESRLILAEGC